MKDKEKDLIENDPLKGSQTDMNTKKNNEDEDAAFESIASQKDNHVKKEFEIGELGNEELQEDEQARDETDGKPGNIKPSQRKF